MTETHARPVQWPDGSQMAAECICTIRDEVILASPDCPHHGMDPAQLRRERDEARAALDALRPSHETPAADEDHQGGNCADIVVSLVGRAMRAEAERDEARAERTRAEGLAQMAERRHSELREHFDDLYADHESLVRDAARLLGVPPVVWPEGEDPEEHPGVLNTEGVTAAVKAVVAQRDSAIGHARVEEGRAGKLYAALAGLTSGAMSRGDAWTVLRETDPIEPRAPVHCTAAQPCEQAGRKPDDGKPTLQLALRRIADLSDRINRAARGSVPEDTARAIADRVRERPAGQELPVALAGAMHRAMCELDRTALTPSSTTVAVMAEYLIARGWPASLRVRDDEGGQQ